MRIAIGFSALLLAATAMVAAEKKAPTGMVCIAAWHQAGGLEAPAHGPNMSATTWAPSADSKFEFRIGKTIKAASGNHQMVTVPNVPADRKLMVGVRLDGRPFESFSIDLRKQKDRRLCLRLYENYWHWVDMGWDASAGCKCGGKRQ